MARVFCFCLGLWIVSFAAALSLALPCSAGEGGRHRRRNVLQSGSPRQSQLDWFRQAGTLRGSALHPSGSIQQCTSYFCSSLTYLHTNVRFLWLSTILLDKDRRSWPELFSVDQDTRKEMIIGVVTENPWGTLCNSISECTS